MTPAVRPAATGSSLGGGQFERRQLGGALSHDVQRTHELALAGQRRATISRAPLSDARGLNLGCPSTIAAGSGTSTGVAAVAVIGRRHLEWTSRSGHTPRDHVSG